MLFSPNRLLTSKEQWLLVLVAAALLLGTVSLYWHGRRAAGRALAEEPAPAAVQAAETPPPPPPATPAPAPEAPQTLAAPETPAAAVETTPATVPEPVPIAVAVRGGVRRGGLFRLPPGSRVADLIMEAGGAREDADVSGLNLAAPLADGTTLTVPVAASRSVSEDRLSLRGAAFRLEENPAHYLTANVGMAMAWSAAPASAAAPAPAPAPVSAAPQAATAKGGLINLNTAAQSEIENLPGIGPVLAGRIVAQRDARPFRSVDEVAEVPGIGPKRLEAMRPLVSVQ